MSVFAVEAWVAGRAGASTNDEHLVAMSTVVRGECEVRRELSGAMSRYYKFDEPFIVTARCCARQVVMSQVDQNTGIRKVVAREALENVGIVPDYIPPVGALLRWVGSKAGVIGPEPSVEDALQRGREAFE